MDSIRKDRFKRSLLSSAILISIQSFTSTASAGVCPAPNPGNNIHVVRGEFCNGVIINSGKVNNAVHISSASVKQQIINDGNVKNIAVTDSSTVSGITNIHKVRRKITVSASHVSGTISNDGSAKHLIVKNGSTINEINNSGNLKKSLTIRGQSEVTANVTNSGTIRTLRLLDSTVQGNVDNTRLIKNGIILNNSTISGKLNNEGLIDVGPGGKKVPLHTPVKAGISLEGNSSVGSNTHGIFNHGTIRVQTGIEHDGVAFNSGAQANGIQIIGNADSGRIENHGEIMADTYDIYVNGTTIDGSIVNYDSGTIETGDNGIYLKDAHIKGSVTSSGRITSTHDNTIDFENATLDSGVVVTFLSSHPDYDALSIDDSKIAGNVITQRPLAPVDPETVTISGNDGLDIDNTDIAGAVISSGNITAQSEGFDFDNTNIGSWFINIGNITARGTGISLEGEYAEAEDGTPYYLASIGGGFDNSGTINAGEHGIDLNRISIVDSFKNYGDIHTDAGSAITLSAISIGHDFINAGDLFADEVMPEEEPIVDQPFTPPGFEAAQRGISVTGNYYDNGALELEAETTIGGRFVNTGNIQTLDEGIFVTGTSIGADFTNSGNITSLTSTGIDLYDARIQGAFVNEGDIAAEQGYGIRVAGTSSIGQGFLNSGTIHAGDDGVLIADTELGSDLKNIGEIIAHSGSVINIDNTIINGNIENQGLLALTEDGNDGIDLNQAIVQGDIINVGALIALRNDAIEINHSAVDGSVINNGTIRAGDHGFEIDGNYENRVVIGGNLENNGSIYTGVTENGLGNSGNGIDIDDLDLRGSLIHAGTMDVTEDGFNVDDMIVAGDFIATGAITARDNGIVLAGSRRWHQAEETTDGVIPEHYTQAPTTIGGRFYNSGAIRAGETGIDLSLVAVGVNGITEDGAGNFENHGNITAGDGSAMDIRASSAAGDFINSAELTANTEASYSPGDHYSRRVFEASPDGQIEMAPLGVDEHGNAWFKIKNQGQNFQPMTLTEDGGGFTSAGTRSGNGDYDRRQ